MTTEGGGSENEFPRAAIIGRPTLAAVPRCANTAPIRWRDTRPTHFPGVKPRMTGTGIATERAPCACLGRSFRLVAVS